MSRLILLLGSLLLLATLGADKPAPPAAANKVGKLPFLEFDARTKRVRVECETVNVDAPLEFFCVARNGPDHETVLRSPVRPSDLHAALLAVGLKPGSPVSYSEETEKWTPATGPALRITCEYQKDGKTVTVPAHRMMRNLKTREEMSETTWIFAGSRVMEDPEGKSAQYAADVTGYIVSVVNFDLTVIDIPDLASNSNETLEWVRNPETVPPGGTKVYMVIEPAGDAGPTKKDAAKAAGGQKPAAGAKAQ